MNEISTKKLLYSMYLKPNFFAHFKTTENVAKQFIQKSSRLKTFADSIESLLNANSFSFMLIDFCQNLFATVSTKVLKSESKLLINTQIVYKNFLS
jgi:hypothetical protein